MDLCILNPKLGGYIAVGSEQHRQQQVDKDLSCSSSPSSSASDDVFSVVSDASSQSSLGDVEELRRSTDALGAAKEKFQSLGLVGAEETFKPLPQCQLQNPRRSLSTTNRIPPPLPRQEERKILFVNDLVDSATNLVSVIWPLSSLPCGQANGNKGILPLRRYIEETLRRSRTSYSTLQVALYYLILIKSHVPRHDMTMEQKIDCASMRAMQCGRRMFLAALILASKYLQDRNYSAKAWSKMSGLKTTEINGNERMFLSAVSWKLHIPDHIFKRWTDIVLQFTAQPSAPSPGCGLASMDSQTVWSQLIPLLTPTLDDPRILALPSKIRPLSLHSGLPSPTSMPHAPVVAPLQQTLEDVTPLGSTGASSVFESPPDRLPPTPGLARMGPLPTPAMTPSSIAASTPAVSTCNSRRPSMSMAMSQAQNSLLCRLTQDRHQGTLPRRSDSVRSVMSSQFPFSSPESMTLDVSRSSRSSSISSVSIAPSAAPLRAFARPAISRSNSNDSMTIDPSMLMKDASIADHEVIDITKASPYHLSQYISNDFSPASTGTSHPVTPLGESRKRCRSNPSAEDQNRLQNQVRSFLLDAATADNCSPMTVVDNADDRTPTPGMPHRAVARRAMGGGVHRSSSLRTLQPIKQACTPIRRAVSTSQRSVDVIDQESPRKRFKSMTCQDKSSDLFMVDSNGIWQTVA